MAGGPEDVWKRIRCSGQSKVRFFTALQLNLRFTFSPLIFIIIIVIIVVWNDMHWGYVCHGLANTQARGNFELHDTRIQWKNDRTLNTYKWPCETIVQAVWTRTSKHIKSCCQLELEIDGGSHVTFAGFQPQAKAKISTYITDKCKVEMTTDNVECSGQSWGDINFEGMPQVVFVWLNESLSENQTGNNLCATHGCPSNSR